MTVTIERDTLHQAIDQLPENTLIELAKFVEFLQFKEGQLKEGQQNEQMTDQGPLLKDGMILFPANAKGPPPFNPVYFPEGILQGFDFSPETIVEARKEMK